MPHTGTVQYGKAFTSQPSQGYFPYWRTLNLQRRGKRLPELHKLFPLTFFFSSETDYKIFAIQNWVMQRNTVPMHWNNGMCETYLPRNYKQKPQPSLNSVQLYARVNFIQLKKRALPNWSLGFGTTALPWHCQDTASLIPYQNIIYNIMMWDKAM